MDKHNIALRVCKNSQVLANLSKRRTFIKTPKNQEWVSVLKTVSTTGHYIWPVMVFKGKTVQTTWFGASEILDWLYTTSENGWTSNKISFCWC